MLLLGDVLLVDGAVEWLDGGFTVLGLAELLEAGGAAAALSPLPLFSAMMSPVVPPIRTTAPITRPTMSPVFFLGGGFSPKPPWP